MEKVKNNLDSEILDSVHGIYKLLNKDQIYSARYERSLIEKTYGDYIQTLSTTSQVRSYLSELDDYFTRKSSSSDKDEKKDIKDIKEMSLDDKIKEDQKRREEREKEWASPEFQAKLEESNRKYEASKTKTKIYTSDLDYYEDVYYMKGFFGTKKYFSHYTGNRVKREIIPDSVISTIRDDRTYFMDSMTRTSDKFKQLTPKKTLDESEIQYEDLNNKSREEKNNRAGEEKNNRAGEDTTKDIISGQNTFLDNINKLGEHIKRYKEEIIKLRDQVCDLNREKNQYLDKIKELEQKRDEFEKEIHDQNDDIKQLEKERDELAYCIKEITTGKTEKDIIKQLVTERDNWKDKYLDEVKPCPELVDSNIKEITGGDKYFARVLINEDSINRC